MSDTKHLALIGMMGVGKSTAGRALAARRGARFVDTDEVIEIRTGRTLRELWCEGGEAAYRDLECRAVECALASDGPVVLATPGGVAVDRRMAGLLDRDDVEVVHLRAGLDTLVRHVGPHPLHRPLLGADPRATLARLLAERGDVYEAMADHVVDIDGLTPAGVVRQVQAALTGARSPVSA
jgi:shikimate kinase